MLSRRKYTTLLGILIHTSIYIKCSHQLSNSVSSTTAAKQSDKTSGPASKKDAGVEDILNDTILLLDALDQKLASVKNKTSSAMVRDNLRSLDGAYNDESEWQDSSGKFAISASQLADEALLRLAEEFSPGRKNDAESKAAFSGDQLVAAASEQRVPALAQLVQISNVSNHGSETSLNGPKKTVLAAAPVHLAKTAAPLAHNASSNDGKSNNINRGTGAKRARQLQQTTSPVGTVDEEHRLANDSTERHIRFTLDLMQSIFASQSYTAKTNQIESFLISPLSIQMVLMMMHLGARGQTRSEISNCLHLSVTPAASHQMPAALIDFDKSHATASSGQQQLAGSGYDLSGSDSISSKLKRRHQQPSQNSASSSSGSENGKQQSAKAKVHNSQQATTTTNSRHQQQASSSQASANPHELFGASMRNLLKDPIVMKALTSANQIFLQKNLPLSAQYEWAIRHYYGADVKLVDFHRQSATSQALGGNSEKGKLSKETLSSQNSTVASAPTANVTEANGDGNNIQQMINEWIERQTKGRISNFLSAPVPTSTLLMAINVLYFRGDWQYKFDPTDTESDAWFTQANGNTVKTPMMVNRLPLAFAHDPAMKTSVIELPYKAQRLGLFLLLPDEVSGIFHTMQMLNSTSFANLISSMRKPSPAADQAANGINVRIPKFSIESSPKLSQILSQQLGLKSLFMPDMADLSGLFSSHSAGKQRPGAGANSSSLQHKPGELGAEQQQVPLQVGLDELLHKAVLQVDEQGSVAAASSATIVERVGLFNSNYFEADHPFLLFLMDKQTGLVLFSGVFAGNTNDSTGGGDGGKSVHSNSRSSDTLRKHN